MTCQWHSHQNWIELLCEAKECKNWTMLVLIILLSFTHSFLLLYPESGSEEERRSGTDTKWNSETVWGYLFHKYLGNKKKPSIFNNYFKTLSKCSSLIYTIWILPQDIFYQLIEVFKLFLLEYSCFTMVC